jgi:hypothetical protein
MPFVYNLLYRMLRPKLGVHSKADGGDMLVEKMLCAHSLPSNLSIPNDSRNILPLKSHA